MPPQAQETANIGIQETKELLEFGFNLQEAITKSLSDGKINLLDVPKFLGVIKTAGSAFSGINKIKAELADIAVSEKQELIEFARERFDLPNNQLEILIEDTLEEVLNIYKLATRWANSRTA